MNMASSNSDGNDVTYEFVRNEKRRARGIAQLKSICLVCTRPVVEFPTPKKKKMWVQLHGMDSVPQPPSTRVTPPRDEEVPDTPNFQPLDKVARCP